MKTRWRPGADLGSHAGENEAPGLTILGLPGPRDGWAKQHASIDWRSKEAAWRANIRSRLIGGSTGPNQPVDWL